MRDIAPLSYRIAQGVIAPATVKSDALVFFGATGDLAYKKIFPALHSMIRRGALTVPIIGVAKSGWTIEQLRTHARDSVNECGGGVDEAAFATLVHLLHYVDGDYQDPIPSRSCAACLARRRIPYIIWRFRRACLVPWSKRWAAPAARAMPVSFWRNHSVVISLRRSA